MNLFTEPEVLNLRPYQSEYMSQIREGWKAGHIRQIVSAPTGAGKTEIACAMLQKVSENGGRALMVCDMITLVSQTSERLSIYGIHHDVRQGENTTRTGQAITVASEQTLSRRKAFPKADLIIIDEAHRQREGILSYMHQSEKRAIGLSATPLTQGLGKHYSRVIQTVTTNQLLADGYLAPLKIYAIAEPDMDGAKVSAGEWTGREAGERGLPLIPLMYDEWIRRTQEHFGGIVPTLIFSATIAHGEAIVDYFQQQGIDARQTTAYDDADATMALVRAYREQEFPVLVSVEKCSIGFDVPDVRCIIGARAYRRSIASVVQQMGRGMRTADGKDYCLYLDMAGNAAGFADRVRDIWEHGVKDLDVGEKKTSETRREEGEREDVVCPECQLVRAPGVRECLGCGHEWKRPEPVAVETIDGMAEIDMSAADVDTLTAPGSRQWLKAKRWVYGQMLAVGLDWCRGDMARARKLALAQYRSLYSEWPPREWGDVPAQDVNSWTGQRGDPRVRRKMKALSDEYRRGRK